MVHDWLPLKHNQGESLFERIGYCTQSQGLQALGYETYVMCSDHEMMVHNLQKVRCANQPTEEQRTWLWFCICAEAYLLCLGSHSKKLHLSQMFQKLAGHAASESPKLGSYL